MESEIDLMPAGRLISVVPEIYFKALQLTVPEVPSLSKILNCALRGFMSHVVFSRIMVRNIIACHYL